MSTDDFDIILAAVAVTDLERAERFYELVLDRPADVRPMPTLAQWNLDPSGGLQVVEAPEQAGRGMVTLLTRDFDRVVAALGERGLVPSEVVSGVVSRLTQVGDPDGNVVTVAEIPAD